MLEFFHRDGTPYPDVPESVLAWGSDHERFGNRVVDSSYTLYGEWISTVWMGFDQAFGFGRPLLFETMMFDRKGAPKGQWRWSTEVEARIGHERVYYMSLIPPPLRWHLFGGVW